MLLVGFKIYNNIKPIISVNEDIGLYDLRKELFMRRGLRESYNTWIISWQNYKDRKTNIEIQQRFFV